MCPNDPAHADPHGYKKLSQILSQLEAEVQQIGRKDLARVLYEARAYQTGSATEFLGESRMALRRVLASGEPLRPETLVTVHSIIADIETGFGRSGTVLPERADGGSLRTSY